MRIKARKDYSALPHEYFSVRKSTFYVRTEISSESIVTITPHERPASLLDQQCQLHHPAVDAALLQKEVNMLGWALTFFVVAIIAAFLGFGGIAAGAAEIAKIIFFLFLILFVIALLARALRGWPPI